MTANTPTGRGRQADQARRRQRLINTIQDADQSGDPVSVSSIARAAGVDRSFLYRHPDLLAQVHAAQSAPAGGAPGSAAVSHAALQADLANALDRSHRLAARVRQLEARLSEMLGEKAWHATGLGAPTDIDELQRKLARLEQAQIDLAAQLDERTEELRAAREANRELTRALNQRHLLFSQRGDVVQLGALPDHRVLVRFGFKTSPQVTTWNAMLEAWRAADEIAVCIGGSETKRRTLRTAARFARHWNFGSRAPVQFARGRDVLRQHCADIGRDPDGILPSPRSGSPPTRRGPPLRPPRSGQPVPGWSLSSCPPHAPAVLAPLACALSGLT